MFRRVFVLYPRGLRTGGPEAMHQLVHTLRAVGQDAVLVPRAGTESALRAAAYAHYDAPEVAAVEDASDCAVVAPEDEIGLLAPFSRAARFCWWLSIDNSSAFRQQQLLRNAWAAPARSRLGRLRMRAAVPAHQLRRRLTGERALLDRVEHLAQSQYAWSFVHSVLGRLPSLVSDWTPVPEGPPPIPAGERRRTVAYNPVKSGFVVDHLRERVTDVEWIPLQGLDRAGVVETLGRTAVYLDLGHHPGKDRLPREAALCDAVTVVARRGAGALWADVPIEADFKVSPGDRMIEAAAAAVDAVLRDPVAAWGRQEHYRRTVRSERPRFEREVRNVFVDGRLGEDTVEP